MKKISFIIAIVMITCSLTMSVMGYGLKFDNESVQNSSIACVDFLDFSEENNNWAYQNEDGEWIPNFDIDNAWDENNDWYPSQACLSNNRNYGYSKCTEGQLDWSLIDNGEVLHLESISPSTAPAMSFYLDSDRSSIAIGREEDGNMEYCKIRIRNYSTAKQFSIGKLAYLGSGTAFFPSTLIDVPIENNSSKWITYTFSLLDYNIATNYGNDLNRDSDGNLISRWSKSYMGDVLIFPFGYNKENATGAYEGATMDIDYIVFGSKAYVENYTSKLEEKEKNASSIKIINEPKQKTYYVGDTINLDGLGLEVTYKDGTKEIIESANVDYNFDNATKDSTVTLQYGEASTSFKVEVIGITGMEIETKPDNPTYEVAKIKKDFAPKDIKMRVSYADGTTSIIGLDKAKLVYDFDVLELGEHEVTIEYYGYKCSLKVNIINVVDIKIEFEKEIKFGDSISIGNFVVTCVYSDGSEKELSAADIHEIVNIEYDTKVIGQPKALIRITNPEYEIDFTKTTNIKIAEPESLLVTCTKRIYNVGEEFDISRLKVEYKYENQKVELDRDYYTIEYDFTKPGTQPVIIKDVFFGMSYQISAIVHDRNVSQATDEETTQETTEIIDITTNNSMKVFVIITISVIVCAGIVVVIIILRKKSVNNKLQQ